MIINILKLIFLYFLYRFIKLMIKGYIIKKIKKAAEEIHNRKDDVPFGYTTKKNSQKTEKSGKKNGPKTFDADYKVVKD